MSTEKYAVYLIIYRGNKLPLKSKNSIISPRRYIGSSKVSNISNGYLGSVSSKKYSKIWLEEIKTNPSLFKLRVLSIHDNDISAREEEKRLQIKYNAVKSDLYVNLSLASPKGYFGKPDIGRVFSSETKDKMRNVRKGRSYEEIFGPEKAKELIEKRKQQKNWNKGKTKNDNDKIKEYGKKISKTKLGGMWITNEIEDKYICDRIIPNGWRKGRTNGRFLKCEIQCLTCKKIIQGLSNFNSHVLSCDYFLQEEKRKILVKEILSKTTKKQRKLMNLGNKWRTLPISELEKLIG